MWRLSWVLSEKNKKSFKLRGIGQPNYWNGQRSARITKWWTLNIGSPIVNRERDRPYSREMFSSKRNFARRKGGHTCPLTRARESLARKLRHKCNAHLLDHEFLNWLSGVYSGCPSARPLQPIQQKCWFVQQIRTDCYYTFTVIPSAFRTCRAKSDL